ENITDSQVFLDEFNRKMAELDKMQNEIISLKEQRLELDRNQPDDSTEDLQYNLTLEKKEFDTTLHKGKAYKRIQTELNTILNELDKDTFEPLKIRTEHYFHKLTGGKYNTVKMQETIPSEIELNGTWLPENLLSTGTLDLLALATRLAMADFYLEDKSGFIVLDDPLVNLDPARQEMAAACLREIAEEKQVIVLTCHPSHAAMLQGDLIEL
ncbi:MAG: ATP-binding protein, partial [Bacteroidia bacterium]